MGHNEGTTQNFITPYGGRAVELMNRYASPICIGDVVQLSPAGLKGFTVASAGTASPIGVSFESVESGELCWVVTDGIQPVNLQSGTGCLNNDVLRMSASEPGRVVVGGTGSIVGWALDTVAPGAGGRVTALLRAVPSGFEVDWADVTDYGAIGDGVADDTAAIRAAILSVSSGGVVYFPPGTYFVSAYLSLVDSVESPLERVTFQGDGSCSIISAGFPNDAEASGASVFFGGAVVDLEFKDFVIQQHSTGGYQRGFRFGNNATRVSIHDLTIDRVGWDGLHATAAAGVWFDGMAVDCSIEDCRITDVATSVFSGYGIMFYTGATSHRGIAIRRNLITGRAGALPAGGIWVFNTVGSIIEENTIRNIGHYSVSPDASGYGILTYGLGALGISADTQIVGNKIETTNGTGIYCQSTLSARVVRNLVVDVAKVQSSASLLCGGIAVNVAPAEIIDNHIINVGVGNISAALPSGISMQTALAGGSWPTVPTSGMRCTGNYIENSPVLGIRFSGLMLDSVIDGNTCKNTVGGIGAVVLLADNPGGCTISNNTVVRDDAALDGAIGIALANGRNCTISGNVVSRAGGQGIWVSTAQQCTVIGNTVRDSGQRLANAYDGIEIAASDICTISGNKSYGVSQRYGIAETGNNNTIVGNIFGGDTGGKLILGVGTIDEHNQSVNIAAVVDYYVSTTGDDADDGSLATPWLTIQHAVDTVPSGAASVINLIDGPFQEHVLIDSKSHITIKPMAGPVLVDGSYTSGIFPIITNNWAVFKIIDSENIVIRDLIITNDPDGHVYTGCNQFYYPSPLGVQVMDVAGGCKNISIINNVITQVNRINGAHCIAGWDYGGSLPILVAGETAAGVSNIIISGNEIFDCDTSPPPALGQYSQVVTITGNVEYFSFVGNELSNLDSSGIAVCGGYYPALGILDHARGGFISDNTFDGIDTEAIYINGGRTTVIDGNTITNCDYGISVHTEVGTGGAARSIRVRNNVVVSCWVGITTGAWSGVYGDVERLEVYNNTLVNNLVGMDVLPKVYDSYITNNIVDNVVAVGPGLGVLFWDKAVGDTITINNNMWFVSDGTPDPARFFLGVSPGVAKAFSEYRTETGQDANGYFEAPNFSAAYRIAPPSSAILGGSTTLHLAVTSIPCGCPCVDDCDPYGALDFYGEPRQTGFGIDIGASEYHV